MRNQSKTWTECRKITSLPETRFHLYDARLQIKTKIEAKAEIAETKMSEAICFSYGRPTRRCASNRRPVAGGFGTSRCQSATAAGKLCDSRTMSQLQQTNAEVHVESPGGCRRVGDKPVSI